MDFVDYYAVLGVTPSASSEELRQVYRLAARRFHPDINQAPGAVQVFRSVNQAYEILSDAGRRAEYDKLWRDLAIDTPSLTVAPLLSRRTIHRMHEPQLMYALIKIQPHLEKAGHNSAPLNICLVIDRSTSMKGTRLQHVKAAVHQIIDECAVEDIISAVVFSDDAEVLIPAQHPEDKRGMKSLVSAITADGATAMYAGMRAGLAQIERYRHARYVNHIVLITDGRTYGDEEKCLALADEARVVGVGISGMGIGEDWNDRFLDSLASKTGGSSAYVSTSAAVSHFLQDRILSLATAYAEQTGIIIAPGLNTQLTSVIRTTPNPMALPFITQPIPLGTLDASQGLRLMLHIEVRAEDVEPGPFFIGRIVVSGRVLGTGRRSETSLVDLFVEITDKEVEEEPPAELLDALSRIALYQLQDRARQAMDEGNVAEATRKLEFLSTRLFESGADDLGQAALNEAHRVAHTKQLSQEGVKQLKYGTRALMPIPGDEHD